MNSKTYNERKAAGVCVKCGRVKPIEGQVLCEKCRDLELFRRRANYAKNKPYKEKQEEKEMTYSELLRKYVRKDNYKTALIIAEMMKDAPSTGVVYYLEQKLGEVD